jgi:hypothetical protein
MSAGPRWVRNIVIQGTDTNFPLLCLWNIFSGVSRRISASRQNQTQWVPGKNHEGCIPIICIYSLTNFLLILSLFNLISICVMNTMREKEKSNLIEILIFIYRKMLFILYYHINKNYEKNNLQVYDSTCIGHLQLTVRCKRFYWLTGIFTWLACWCGTYGTMLPVRFVLRGMCFVFSFCDYYVENRILNDFFKRRLLVCNPLHIPHYQATSHHYKPKKKNFLLQ